MSTKTFHIKLSDENADKLEVEATKQHRSATNMIETIVRQWLNKEVNKNDD